MRIWTFLLIGLTSMMGQSHMAEASGFGDLFTEIGADWYVAEYNFAHDMFDTDWRQSQVQAAHLPDGSGLKLRLDPHEGGMNRFAGASVRREEASHYGLYEVRMRAARQPGVVTGFFTYTGPHYGSSHHEIDIEFLGRNTRQMHVAWFVDGHLENKFIDLGFDAAEKFADYAFAWCPDRLRWFADGKLIYEHLASDAPIPTLPGRLFVNVWAADPSIASWAGEIDAATSTSAEIAKVRFTPLLEDLAVKGTYDLEVSGRSKVQSNSLSCNS